MSGRSDQLVRTVVWRNLSADGRDHCSLWRTSAGWRLQGVAIAVLEQMPMLARYEVHCDQQWRTRRVMVECAVESQMRSLVLTVDSDRRWKREENEIASVAGCIDVDLAITPATNTLPIRRLHLAAGESAPVTAAWIKFPDLNLEKLSQTYTRLAEDRYLYQSSTGFSAQITVDAFGLVRLYPGGWERLA